MSVVRTLLLGLLTAVPLTAQGRDPAAVFLTWRGDPTSSVTVDWHLRPGTEAPRVEVRGPGIDGWRAVDGESFRFPFSDRTVRRADLTGLQPDATYELRFGEGTRSYRYRTLPARLTRTVRFATGGDTQSSDSTFGRMNRIVAAHDLDFVLFGGDLAYANGDPARVRLEEAWFETVTRSLVTHDGRLIPVLVAIGNHETVSRSRFATEAAADSFHRQHGLRPGDSPYYNALIAMPRNHRYGAVDFGDYLSILLLNSDHTAPVDGEQASWLRSALEERDGVRHIFPVYHVPAYPSVRAFEGPTSARIRQHWVPLFEKHRVPLVFENHDHLYKRTFPLRGGKRHPQGIVYMGDGAWGVNPREIGRDQGGRKPWYLTQARPINHALIVSLHGDSVAVRTVDGEQRIIDEHATRSRTAARAASSTSQGQRSWLAGDHHIHSRFSVGWDTTSSPPAPVVAGDARYPIPTNAEMARKHGLAWMVSTDHGGPNHSKVNLEMAYPELLRSRQEVSDLIQFFGMEFDPPAGEHASLIVPNSPHEHTTLHGIESRFSRREPWPADPAWNTEERMLEALRYMKAISEPPVLITNHPARTATGLAKWGANTPRELRNWNDEAPRVAVGMEGAPGHQAAALHPDGSRDSTGARGGYRNSPTLGGYDQMTARLGGFWDSMLGEGRRWWVTSTSDSHVHWREGGSDFWPGEYSKTYVHAERSYADVLDGLRNGRVFVTTGDLVSELEVTARGPGSASAGIGGALVVPAGSDVRVTIRVRDPGGTNHHGDRPEVARVDLIAGEVHGPSADRDLDTNPTTRVVRRFTAADWRRDGEYLVMEHTLDDLRHAAYLRVRGTNTGELEPEPDPAGEDPWSDLWFYSNPVFLQLR